MKYDIVFSDIDGTLINTSHVLTQETIEAVRSLKERGIPFVLISGRLPAAIKTIIGQMGFSVPYIAYSGGLVFNEKEEEVYSNRMNATDTKTLLDVLFARWPHGIYGYYAGWDWYVTDDSVPWIQREIKIVEVTPEVKDFYEILSSGKLPHKLLCMCDEETIAEMEAFLVEKFPHLYIVKSSPFMLEMMDKNTNKAIGIEHALSYYGIPKEKAIAFGDNYNDKEMLEYVGHGVAMGNAPSNIKDIANDATVTNDEHGVAVYIKKLLSDS